MDGFARLKQAIAVRVTQADVILAMLQRIEDDIGFSETNYCTYAAHFSTYRYLNVQVTKLLNQLCNNYNVDRRLNTAHNRLNELRSKRYERVCGHCQACLTRRKLWPQKVNNV